MRNPIDLLSEETTRQIALLRAVVGNVPDVVITVVDPDMRYLMVEGGGREKARVNPAALVGRTLMEALPAYLFRVYGPLFRDALNGVATHLEYLARDGMTVYESHGVPLYGDDGQIIAAMCASRDMTGIHLTEYLLRESEMRYRLIVEDQTEIICRLNKMGRLTFVNQAFCAFFGGAHDSLLGRHMSALLPPRALAQFEESVSRLSHHAPVDQIELKLHPSAPTTGADITLPWRKKRWLHWTNRAIFSENGQHLGYQAVGHDITNQKKAEKSERKQRALADALREIAAALHGTLDFEQVLDCVMNSIDHVVPYQSANIMLLRDNTVEVVRNRGYSAPYQHALRGLRLPLEAAPHLLGILHGENCVITDTAAQPDLWFRDGLFQWIRSYVGAPILSQGDVIGFLNLESESPGTFSRKHARRLRAFSEHAALAIRNAQLHLRLQHVAVWEERQRIARELHDAVSQTLFSANMVADALPHLWHKAPGSIPAQLATLRQYTQIALAEMRAMLYELRPQTLENVRLEDLIGQLLEVFSSRTTIEFKLTTTVEPGVNTALDTDTTIGFYRIAQEAVNNIMRHAQAGQAEIRLHFEASGVWLHIRDDGTGFEPGHPEAGHMGLRIMRERADKMGAHFGLTSQVGDGTQIEVRWQRPWKKPTEKSKVEGL